MDCCPAAPVDDSGNLPEVAAEHDNLSRKWQITPVSIPCKISHAVVQCLKIVPVHHGRLIPDDELLSLDELRICGPSWHAAQKGKTNFNTDVRIDSA